MPLILKPTLDDFNRAELETWIDSCRARRMEAAGAYHQGKLAKLDHESDKIQRKMKQHLEMLAKEIEQFDKLDKKLEQRLANLQMLQQELGVVGDMMQLHGETGE